VHSNYPHKQRLAPVYRHHQKVNFDEPMTRDPLFWAGIVIGTVWAVISVAAGNLTGLDAVWTVVASIVATTWVGAGVIAALIREFYRRWRDRRADLGLLMKEDAVLKETE
jgi:hypothetical protein